jgi:hypothetical protein
VGLRSCCDDIHIHTAAGSAGYRHEGLTIDVENKSLDWQLSDYQAQKLQTVKCRGTTDEEGCTPKYPQCGSAPG